MKIRGHNCLQFVALCTFETLHVHMKNIELHTAKICMGPKDLARNEKPKEEAVVALDERFVYDTYAIRRPDSMQFKQGETYTIEFTYLAEILVLNTGIFCALDPDF